jgi:hypothetical protein
MSRKMLPLKLRSRRMMNHGGKLFSKVATRKHQRLNTNLDQVITLLNSRAELSGLIVMKVRQ